MSIVFPASLLGTIFVVIAVANFIAERKRLRKLGLPNPLFLIYQRSLALFVPWPSVSVSGLKGRKAYLWWDIRWVSGGETMARIVDIHEDGKQLVLNLESPVECGPTRMTEVVFHPRGWTPYGKRQVFGYLTPEVDKGLNASAGIVIYPEGA